MNMVFGKNIDHLEDVFLSQFEQEDNQFLYRKHGRGAPIPVSIQEMEDFRLQYRKASRRLIWGLVVGVFLAIALAVFVAPTFIDEGLGIMVIVSIMIAGMAVLSVRNSTAPARALERRTPVGHELSKNEWQSKHFSTTSWALLGSIFLIATLIFISLMAGSDFQEWSDYLWAFGSGVFSILGARALWLKRRLSRGLD